MKERREREKKKRGKEGNGLRQIIQLPFTVEKSRTPSKSKSEIWTISTAIYY
jgi:hypothetical protein